MIVMITAGKFWSARKGYVWQSQDRAIQAIPRKPSLSVRRRRSSGTLNAAKAFLSMNGHR